MGLRKKGAISSFVQSGNFENSTLTGFEPATLSVAVGHLTHYTKFPYEKFFKIFKPNVKIGQNENFIMQSGYGEQTL